MSAFGTLFTALQTRVDKSRSGGDVNSQVHACFTDAMEAIKDGAEIPEFYKHIPEVFAGQMAEDRMLANTNLIIDQLQADGRRALPAEVRMNIILAIRDIKIQSLEQDGYVNPVDATVIKFQAGSLRKNVRNYLLSARMSLKNSGIGDILDAVELRLLEDATNEHGRNYEHWMRAAQASVWAVCELREQQLVRK